VKNKREGGQDRGKERGDEIKREGKQKRVKARASQCIRWESKREEVKRTKVKLEKGSNEEC
jgi:hypothetical protein